MALSIALAPSVRFAQAALRPGVIMMWQSVFRRSPVLDEHLAQTAACQHVQENGISGHAGPDMAVGMGQNMEGPAVRGRQACLVNVQLDRAEVGRAERSLVQNPGPGGVNSLPVRAQVPGRNA